jgi:mRNA-degrading endonuclease toxin of MazEF toxin-antitoxin module
VTATRCDEACGRDHELARSKDSVVNVTALVTLDKTDLEAPTGHVPTSLMNDVDRGLRRVLKL